MSYRKRPYRDKKDEVLAESEKLRKDIENLENALALHARYNVEDQSGLRGLIRQEINGSRWEYGAEGKLTTFRSAQDLHLDSSRQQRSSSGRQSSRDTARQKSSRRPDKSRKTGKEKIFNKKENIQTVCDESDFHSLDPSIENIARLINSADDISKTSDMVEERKDTVAETYHTRHTDLTALELDNLKSKVLARASVNIIRRNPKLSSSLKKTKDLPVDVKREDVEKKMSLNDTRESSRTAGKGNKSTKNYLQKQSSSSVLEENKEKNGSTGVNHHETLHTGRREVQGMKAKTLQHTFSDKEDKLFDKKQGQRMDKALPSEQSKLKDQQNRMADSKMDACETGRPPSRSQTSKLNLLSNLYGETDGAAEESLKVSDLKSSVYNQIALDLASKKGNEVENILSVRSSRQKKQVLIGTHGPIRSDRSMELYDLPSKKNYGTSKEPKSIQGFVEKDQETTCDHRVREWLKGLDLQSTSEYESLFAQHEMDMSSISMMTPESLREMGIQALGPIMKIMKGVHILNRDKGTDEFFKGKLDVKNNQNSIVFNTESDQSKTVKDQLSLSKGDSVYGHRLNSSETLHREEDIEQSVIPVSFKGPLSARSENQASKKEISPQDVHLESQFKNADPEIQTVIDFPKHTDANVSETMKVTLPKSGPQQGEINTFSSTPICWEKTSESLVGVTTKKKTLGRDNVDDEIIGTSQPRERPSSGKKSKRNIVTKKKETGHNVSRKPPASARIADTGISSASQRASVRQKKQQEHEAANQESLMQQKKRRDDMAAKHLLRRSSSIERNKDRGSYQESQKATLRRSLSFTEKTEAQLKPVEGLSHLDGIVSGRGLDVRHNTSKHRKHEDKYSKQPSSATVDEIGIILSALQDLPRHGATSGLSPRHRKSRSKSKSSGHDLNATLGTVRELQTRLGCLEEQLTAQTSDNEGAKSKKLLNSGSYKIETLANDQEHKTEYVQKDEDKASCKERFDNDGTQTTMEENTKQIMFASTQHMDRAFEISRGVSSPESSICKSKEETNIELSPAQSPRDFASTNLTASSPIQDDPILANTVKQGRGHYYGMRKGGFNFQAVTRPRELGVSYQKESFKGLELNKEDISYSEEDICGEGPFSQVFRGTFKSAEVAIKRLKSPLLPKDKNYFKAEVSMLRELRHPCIVELLGFCNNDSVPLVILEYMACGNLDSLLHDTSKPDLSEAEFYQISHDVSSALMYLHNNQPPVLHLDLKPKNVLLGHGNRAKVADFGFSKLKHEADMKVSRVSKSRLMNSVPSWMAPELLAAREVTAKADVYSFGILLWEMVTREVPYAGCTVFQILEQVRLNQRPIVPSTCPSGLSGLIHLCWDQHPAARPSFQRILKTVEQLPQTDPWSKQIELAKEITPTKESTLTADDPEAGFNSDNATLEQKNASKVASQDIEIELEAPSVSKSLELEPVVKDSVLDEIPTSISPSPYEFELETQAGHTTLFVHAAPLSTSQTPEEEPTDLGQHQSIVCDENADHLDCRSSRSNSKESSEQHPPKATTVGQINEPLKDRTIDSARNSKNIDLRSEITIHSDKSRVSRASKKDSPRFAQTGEDGDETARGLIARYLPTKKVGPLVSKSYDQNVNLSPPKKLLPLRHSLDKLKPKPAVANLNAHGKITGHYDSYDTGGPNTAEKQGSQVIQSATSGKMRSDDQRIERTSQSDAGYLRKSAHPPYADGQPYVPSYYNEMQHASYGHKKPKAESKPGTTEISKKATGSNSLKPKQTFISENEPEAHSAFMRSLNDTPSIPVVIRSQEKPSSLETYKYGPSEDFKEENRTTAKTHQTPFANAVEPERKLKKLVAKDQIADPLIEIRNEIHTQRQEIIDLSDGHNAREVENECSDARDEYGDANLILKQFMKDDNLKDSASKVDDLRLDLKSPDPPNLDNRDNNVEDADESVSVFSKSSHSLTPDGISLDSLSLSNDGDTVVDSLEFLDDLSSEDEQIIPKKKAQQNLVAKKSQNVHAKSKITVEELPQMDTRKSFFLFDDSEDSKPFDIINSISIQGSRFTKREKAGTTSTVASLKKPLQEKKNKTCEETSQSLSRTSNARQRARGKKIVDRTKEAESDKVPVNIPLENRTVTPSKAILEKTAKPRENIQGHSQQSPQQPKFSLTGDLLAKGKQRLKPPASRNENLACDKGKSQSNDPQNQPRFSLDASLLQLQKGQLRSVQTKEPAPLKSATQALLPIHEDGLPSMANILKKALDERRFAMGDNPESQEYTPVSSWSLQDD